ncbi:hypothetical protein BRARA_D01197 [Brassica rapa]|uniref:Uncharacterized protein n=1 Tax=Brassica campestris TaxID=3711 RepID=M4E9I9_BRACM|nr:probable transcription factor At1g11510 [Brassica rapa]RID66031.1 hypothetical protein BRARA_D01197 [Brassica rapa]
MSGKLLKKLEDPPVASSSSEEEEDEDAVANSSSEEEEEETDSETEAEPVAKPLVKPPADSIKVETSSKPETKKKRSSETNEVEAKRVKRVSGEETKKSCFQRVWTGEDEIAVLQGIIDFKTETGSSPYDDKNALYDLVKKSVSFDVTKTQFMEKIRALKKKFENNLGRGKKKGKDPSFSKAHDRKAFDLAKLVWGDNGIMALEPLSAVKSKKVEHAVKKQEEPAVMKQEEPAVMNQEFVPIVDLVARFGVDDLAAKQGWSRLSSKDRERFEEQWKELQLKEFKFYSQKSGFIHEVVTKMAEASRPDH